MGIAFQDKGHLCFMLALFRLFALTPTEPPETEQRRESVGLACSAQIWQDYAPKKPLRSSIIKGFFRPVVKQPFVRVNAHYEGAQFLP